MKQIEVQIMGQAYVLGCPAEGEMALRAAVERVDTAMCKIRDAGKVKARERIAVLASLNLAYELTKGETEAAAAAAAATPAPAAAEAASAAPSAAPETIDARLPGLLSRLDQALAGDGHLI